MDRLLNLGLKDLKPLKFIDGYYRLYECGNIR